MAMEMWLGTQKGVDNGSSMACGIGVKFCSVNYYVVGLVVLMCVRFEFININIDSHWCTQWKHGIMRTDHDHKGSLSLNL